MRQHAPRAVIALTLLLAFATACTSSTMIRTNVPGARVYLNGMYVGDTPFMMSDTKIVGSTTRLRLEADGYAPLETVISRNEEFDVGACIGGVLVLVPFLWIMGYQPDHFYELRPAGYAPPYPQEPYPQQQPYPQQPPPQPYEQQPPPPQPYPQQPISARPAPQNLPAAAHR